MKQIFKLLLVPLFVLAATAVLPGSPATPTAAPKADAYSGCVLDVYQMQSNGQAPYYYSQAASVHCAYLAPSQDPREYGEWVRVKVWCNNITNTASDPFNPHYGPQRWVNDQFSTYTCMGAYPLVSSFTDDHGTGGCCP